MNAKRQIHILSPANVSTIIGGNNLQLTDDALKVVTEIVSQFLKTLESRFTILPISFKGIRDINKEGASAVCLAIAGVSSMKTNKAMVFTDLSETIELILGFMMQEHDLTGITMSTHGEPRLFGRIEAIAAAMPTWEYLISQDQWLTIAKIAGGINSPAGQIRSHIDRLVRHHLVFVDKTSRPLIYRAVELKEDRNI